MLPIKHRHYNPLTCQFEDDEARLNFYPTSYTPAVPETNQCDVEIVGIKSDLAKYITKIQSKNQIILSASENLKAAIVSDPTEKRYRVSNYERSWWGGMIETFRQVVEKG